MSGSHAPEPARSADGNRPTAATGTAPAARHPPRGHRGDTPGVTGVAVLPGRFAAATLLSAHHLDEPVFPVMRGVTVAG